MSSVRNGWLSNFLEMTCFAHFLFCFSTIFCTVILQIWRGKKFAAKLATPRHFTHKQATYHSSPHDTTLPLAHTQTRKQHTPRHFTPYSHPTTHYLLIPAPTFRTLHSTIAPEFKKILFNCVPQIFISKPPTGLTPSWRDEFGSPTLALYQ